ncbi:MAG: serine hydrolase domain-containing protein [Woeseiaceae bacterium]|nr:serine hydrolase domain-containing protein [Woeseiaceae bacterium]
MKKLLLFTTLVTTLFLQLTVSAAPVKLTRAESVGMSSARLANVERRLQALLDEQDTGGFQLLVARRGKVVMYENLGYANVEQKIPVTEQTLFRIYSMTKPVIAVAMMMLYEEGHFSLSDPLSKHIPQFADLEVYTGVDEEGNMLLEAPQREPTIHDLLQHTAGFTYGVFGDTPIDKAYREQNLATPNQNLEEFIDKLASIPLLYQPGTRWVYSVAMDVQGYLIEKWSGQELGTFLEKRLFDPLGMDQTMAWVPPESASLLASMYTRNEAGDIEPYAGELYFDHFNPPAGFSGGAQLISTADDYWRMCQMLLDGGIFAGHRFLSPLTVELMSQDRLRDDIAFRDGLGFGFNVSVVRDNTLTDYPSSNGEFAWAGLASTVFWIDPNEELVVVLMTQFMPFRGAYYGELLHRLVRAAIIE